MMLSLLELALASRLRRRTAGIICSIFLIMQSIAIPALQGAPASTVRMAEAQTTVITVDTSADLDSESDTTTCNYTDGAYVAASDGCTLRRAWIEASARPQADRPIAIHFNLPPEEEGGEMQTPGVWLLSLERALPPLTTADPQDRDGQVQIDGSTQPGGRSDGPPIIIDTNDFNIEVESENNLIRNLAFQGGGGIYLKADGNTLEHIWMGLSEDGQSLALYDPPKHQFMAGGGVYITSDDNIVQHSVISGAFPWAIQIDDGEENLIANNTIGTRADGSVPAVAEALQCLRSQIYDPANWYGGWGIALSGSDNSILENRIAGLHAIQSVNDAPPVALEITGARQRVEGNIIGLDSEGTKVGVCGQGIRVSGRDIQILSNVIVRSRSGLESHNGKLLTAAILASGWPQSIDEITVRMNLVEDGPGDIYQFGEGVPEALALFEPARITSVSGTVIIGVQADGSPCPGCLIDLYRDNGDAIQEALEYIGSATADANGEFAFEMAAPLPEEAGIRTSSTTRADDTIPGFESGTTSRISRLFTPVNRVVIEGPTVGEIGTAYPFTITVLPLTATTPLTYTVTATEATSQTVSSISHAAVATHTWFVEGVKTINVTIQNELSTVSAVHEITIVGEPQVTGGTYLPVIRR